MIHEISLFFFSRNITKYPQRLQKFSEIIILVHLNIRGIDKMNSSLLNGVKNTGVKNCTPNYIIYIL